MKETHREYLAMQAWLHLNHNRLDAAIVILEAMTVLLPADLWVHRTLSYAYMRNEQFSRCLDHMDRHVRLQSTVTDQVVRLRALRGLGREVEARELLTELKGRLRVDES